MRTRFLTIGLFTFILWCCFTAFRPREITWTAIGDSITYLNDHPDETRNRVSSGYLTRVVTAIPSLKYINQGHNGWTAVRIAKEIEQLGLTKTDLYTVFLGTNDWWSALPLGDLNDYRLNTGTGTFNGAYRIIIDKIRDLNPDAKIVLFTPLQRGDFIGMGNPHNNAYGSYQPKEGQELVQFANAVIAIADYEDLKVVDLYHESGISNKNFVKFKRLRDPKTGEYRNYTYPNYTTIPFNPDKDEYPYPLEAVDFTYDGLHPSDKGNKVIADMLIKVLKDSGI
jgi:lysophospholipase L1-like esterase